MERVGEEAEGFLDNLQEYVTLQQVAGEFGLRMRGYKNQGGGFILDTDEGRKYVHRLRHVLDEYRFACAAADFLRGQGFSRLPRATWARTGSPAANVDGINYTMHEWIPGAQADLGNLCQLTQAVEMLAWFHRCGQGFRPAEQAAVRDEWGSWPRRFAARIQDLYNLEDKARASGEDDHFARHFLKHLDVFRNEAARALEELESSPYEQVVKAERERGGICHRDYIGQNLILRDDGALFLSDFDDLAMDSRLEDIGKFLTRHSRWNIERVLFILQVYHGVNPIARPDVACLGAYLRFPAEFWSASSAHFAGRPSDRHVLKRLVEQLGARRQLLDELRRSDLGFLAGVGPLYNLGFAHLPEVPAGKAWTAAARWPAAEEPVVADGGWWETIPAELAGSGEIITEPLADMEPLGLVLDEVGGVGMSSTWPEEMEHVAGEETKPEPVEGAPAAGPEPSAPFPPSPSCLTWRPFPTPLARPMPEQPCDATLSAGDRRAPRAPRDLGAVAARR